MGIVFQTEAAEWLKARSPTSVRNGKELMTSGALSVCGSGNVIPGWGQVDAKAST